MIHRSLILTQHTQHACMHTPFQQNHHIIYTSEYRLSSGKEHKHKHDRTKIVDRHKIVNLQSVPGFLNWVFFMSNEKIEKPIWAI